MADVDRRAEAREFLVSRRAKITTEQARLPQAGQRRVPGLRRSEVAALAGVSVEYYAKIERGALGGVSAGVLDGIARALQLDDAEHDVRTHASSPARNPLTAWITTAHLSHRCRSRCVARVPGP